MFRAILELLLTILAVVVARAILTSVMKGIANAGRAQAPQPSAHQAAANSAPSGAQKTGNLHKDPVCGTYVAESTPFRRQSAGQTFYYCSDNCREKHALVAR